MNPYDDQERRQAKRATRLISHLDGALHEDMLAAMQEIWMTLEHAAADGPAHARAVRSRLFWENLTPGGIAAAPGALEVLHLVPPADQDDEPESTDVQDDLAYFEDAA